MAKANMEFSPSAARASSKQILANSQNIQKQVKNLETTINGLTWWKGDTQTKFKAQFDKIKLDLEKTYKCVSTISEQLETSAKNYEKFEADVSGQIKA